MVSRQAWRRMVRKTEVEGKQKVAHPNEMKWDVVEKLVDEEGKDKLSDDDKKRIGTALHMLGKDEYEGSKGHSDDKNICYNKFTMDKGDLVAFLFIMGLSPTEDALHAEMRYLKLTEDIVTPAQAVYIWLEMRDDECDVDAILKRAFMFFDKDGNGEISEQELRTAMGDVGNMLTQPEIDAFMQLMDRNGDGVVGYGEFFEALTKQSNLGEILSKVKELDEEIKDMFISEQ